MDPCPICLENIEDSVDNTTPYDCYHTYHINCIKQLNKYNLPTRNNCLLCMSDIKDFKIIKPPIKYVFNNMLDGERNFDIDSYLKKWNDHKCFEKNHKFHIETIGDWNCSKYKELYFTYNSMFIECENCKKHIIVK